ncbi:hypothetical protein IA800_12440 [Listeria seeligeri]|uniref:FAD synthetase family protein n=1 Tax=Listeria seeligeri TaxID=1640 RepID=UPI001624B892|nr:hypothetical protein [Listeria seeligeri]MBC1581036.1 hypothetical protein [Listeria seeligeri]MBC1597529.1 hypothetical protein [Listeria seeligeri]MBC1732218.1 hypothetical protein [Listeria seeligeri]MBC1810126.1 hypothetical protein [Listeria seeligeri]MBC2221775.1 hypothetical protein [Listeria seeligeri]
MEVSHVTLEPNKDSRPAVLTIGKFDGVHIGHQKILNTALSLKKPDEILTAISFSPHPLWALKQIEIYREMLTPRMEKEHWLAHFGVDYLIETAFTPRYAETTPEQFVTDHLSNLNLSHIVVGSEFNFGKGRDSDVELLRDLCAPYNIGVTSVPVIETNQTKISSTNIRAFIRRGHFQEAEELLGHPWYISGMVENGEMIDLDDYVLPATGEYQTDTGLIKITNRRTIKVDLPNGLHQIHITNKLS